MKIDVFEKCEKCGCEEIEKEFRMFQIMGNRLAGTVKFKCGHLIDKTAADINYNELDYA